MQNSLVKILRKKRKRIVVEPYSKLAPLYNEVMSHVDYSGWAEYIIQLAYEHIQDIHNIFDFACGTGNLSFYLKCYGYEVSGADGNFDMVENAKLNAKKMDVDIEFYLCDLRQKPEVNKQSLVLCLYDSINYLKHESDLDSFFSGVRQIIRNDGLLIFDCSTEYNSIVHFSKYELTEKIQNTLICRQARYDKSGKIQHNQFEIFPPDEDVVYFEHHQQKIWSIEELSEILENNGFNLVGTYNGYTLKPSNRKSDRVHFAAKPI